MHKIKIVLKAGDRPVKLSIIVPVYNIEKYLARCVDSILGQTFTDFELILVDDGSPDGSGAICDSYAKADQRVVVIHQQNGGPSAARNTGLDAAKGQYIGFVDGDDVIHPQMYEILIHALESTDSDIAQCRILNFADDHAPSFPSYTKEITNVSQLLSNHELIHQFFPEIRYLINPSVCNKVCRRTVYENLRFPLGCFYEDSYMQLPLLAAAKKLVRVRLDLYFYYQRPGSTMHASYAFWCAKDMAAISVNNLTFFRERMDKEQIQYALEDYFSQFCKDKLAIYFMYPHLKKEFKSIQRRFDKEFFQFMKSPKFFHMKKLLLVMLYVSPKMAKKICHKYFPEYLHTFMR